MRHTLVRMWEWLRKKVVSSRCPDCCGRGYWAIHLNELTHHIVQCKLCRGKGVIE